ncbi:MAG: hypothetical protein ACTSWI_05305 [Alphaproteobacteria bacterium]
MDRIAETSFLIANTGRARRQARAKVSISLSYGEREVGFVLSRPPRATVPTTVGGADGQAEDKLFQPVGAANTGRAIA